MTATVHHLLADVVIGVEPTPAELEAIEAEADVIAAEVALVDAECRHLRYPSARTARRMRRARLALIRALLCSPTHSNCDLIGDRS